MAELEELLKSSWTEAPLDRSPKKNWVENAGGLPMYIRRIANHLHAKGHDISTSIAIAVNVAKKMCSTGDLNFPGVQHVNPASRAEACAAVADWEAKKAGANLSKIWVPKGVRVNPTDAQYREILKALGALPEPKGRWVDVHMTGSISKADKPRQLVFGWAQIATQPDGSTVVDKQGDFIDDPTELEDAAYDFTLNSRDGGEMHVRKGVSRLVESFVSTEEKQRAMGIPPGILPVGWWCGFKVDDPQVFQGVVEKRYPMFSVHGRGIRKAI
jgi:uncharacterized protein YndB with AHSA1/START domain